MCIESNLKPVKLPSCVHTVYSASEGDSNSEATREYSTAVDKLGCLSLSSLAVICLIHTKIGRDAEIYFCDYAYIKIAFNASIQIYSIPVVIGVLVSHLQADPAQRFTNPFKSRIARAK